MPISQRFLENFNKKEIKKEFGLKENLKTIIFFAGGRMGLARKNIFEYMQTLANSEENIQVVAVSGKNKKVYEKFKQIAEDKENIKVFEFTNKVPELMSIADLVITKPGGITSSESLASNVPILAINPIPGQEEENAEFLEENKVAIWLRPKDKLEEKLKEMLKDETLNNLKENTKKLGNANAAKEICENILKTMV